AAARRPSPSAIAIGCFALSVTIEAVQLAMNAGRVVDVDDVIFNTGGGLVGSLLAVSAWTVLTGQGRARMSPGPVSFPPRRRLVARGECGAAREQGEPGTGWALSSAAQVQPDAGGQ
ncbi:VanZ family protein, partial [Streptomyces aureocirculatus]|uniref:VanZ family protein n=1 Tax=Streptomyces aureocirculatus TaxID=67275 RepID=UPI0014705386